MTDTYTAPLVPIDKVEISPEDLTEYAGERYEHPAPFLIPGDTVIWTMFNGEEWITHSGVFAEMHKPSGLARIRIGKHTYQLVRPHRLTVIASKPDKEEHA